MKFDHLILETFRNQLRFVLRNIQESDPWLSAAEFELAALSKWVITHGCTWVLQIYYILL